MIKKIKAFAQYARCIMDKTDFCSHDIKKGYINFIINGYCHIHGIGLSYDDSIIPQNIKQRFSADILSADVFDAENLCWLYQYFVSPDRKNTVDAISGLEIQNEEITASTQVFTPKWIVKYMIDNSLGNFYQKDLSYRISDNTEKKDVKKITLMDPACGCGNILSYAFDLFVKMYECQGIKPCDSVSLILKNNIFGVDIDEYSARICKFLLMAKAYKYDKEIFLKNTDTNIFVVDDEYMAGSLKGLPCKQKTFTVVCTNPPYLSRMSKPLKEFLNENMKQYSKDLFTAFMYKGIEYTQKDGYMAYMTPSVWMYLSSHKSIREYVLTKNIASLVELKKGSYFSEASVDICAFVIKNSADTQGMYIKLKSEQAGLLGQQKAFEKAISDIKSGNTKQYTKNQSDFSKHKDKLILCEATDSIYKLFNNKTIGDIFTVKQGMTTGNNKRFLRYWWQVPYSQIGFGFDSTNQAAKSGYKWFPYNKGGKYRKWYGNNHYVVMYENDGEEMKEYTSHLPQGTWVRLKSREYYFKPSITWSFISSTKFGVRYSPEGSIFDVAGSSLFADEYEYVLGFLASSTAYYLLQLTNPTMNYQIRDIKALPYIEDEKIKPKVKKLVKECIAISKEDWDSFETSYDFSESPLLKYKGIALKDAVEKYIDYRQRQKQKLIDNETQINKIFASLYGTYSLVETTPDKVTLFEINKKDIVCDLLSYCVKVYFKNHFRDKATVKSIADFSKQFIKDNFEDDGYVTQILGKSIDTYFETDFICDHKKKYLNKPVYNIKNGSLYKIIDNQ